YLYMQNIFFLKEVLAYLDKNVSLVILNQKQLKQGLDFTLNTILSQNKKSAILINLSTPIEEITQKIAPLFIDRIKIIDAFSKEASNLKNVITVNNSSDLTGIQIAIEKAQNQLSGEKIIIIDALNVLSIYNKKEIIGKFLHLFSNKTRLQNNSALIFCIKESTDAEILEMAKEFSDKVYDYSDLFASTITLAESR
ncbi:MAG: hypothetical protein WCW13_05350, partial [archaeon]